MQTIVKVWENLKYAAPENIHTSHMDVHWIFQGGGGAKKKSIQEWGEEDQIEKCPREGYGYFLEQYNSCSNSISCSPKLPLVFPWIYRTTYKLLSIFLVCDSKVCLVYLVH